MGLFTWLLGKKETPHKPGSLPEEIKDIPAPKRPQKKDLKKEYDTYVKNYLGPIIDLKKKSEYPAAFRLCVKGLPFLGPYMQYLKKNDWWTEKENPPLLHFGLEYASAIGDVVFINNIETVINDTPELEHKRPLLTQAKQANELRGIIYKLVKHSPKYPRVNLKTDISGFDDTTINDALYNMTKYGFIHQSKSGKNVFLSV